MIPRNLKSVIAVDLGGSKVAAASVNSRGAVRDRIEEPVDVSSADGPVEQIVRMCKSIGDAEAVGVAVPGLVRRDGTVWAPNLPGWDAVPLARTLQKKLRAKIVADSDRNAAVLGESWSGAARGKNDVIALILGTGIGAGILCGGAIVRGAHELSGCAGWMVVADSRDPMSRRVGTLESLAAGSAIARLVSATSAIEAAERARRGDSVARDVFKRASDLLGRTIANLVSLFDPETIVLTGGLTKAADLFLDDAKRIAAEYAQPLSYPKVDIVVSTLGTEANLLGVGRLALETR